MQAIRADLIPSSDRSSATDPLSRLFAQGINREQSVANNAIPTQTDIAVQQSDGVDSIDPASQSMAELQALIERLNESTLAADVKAALQAIADFANQSTSASFLGDTVNKLADLADEMLGQIPQNASGASFSFSAAISQQSLNSGDYQQSLTSISFSFSYQDGSTNFQASGSFAQSLEVSDTSLKYQSYEQVSMSITTSNVNLASNPALKAFADLTNQFTDEVQSLFGALQDETPALANGGYRSVSVLELLRLQFESLNDASNDNQSLLEALEAMKV